MTAKPKRLSPRPQDKLERSTAVLLALVELYIQSGKPVGSSTLQRVGFTDWSSATIRNYFALLEQQGLLSQEHSSSGRIPTAQGLRVYAEWSRGGPRIDPATEERLSLLCPPPSKGIATYLQQATALLSEMSQCAAFCLSPRLDQDSILRIRLIPIDPQRLVAVLVTECGLVMSELICSERWHFPPDLSLLQQLLENRLQGRPSTVSASRELLRLVEWLFTELLMRQMTKGSDSRQGELIRLGISELLAYPEFSSAEALSPAVALFDSPTVLKALCFEAASHTQVSFWIGDHLPLDVQSSVDCAVAAIPYYVGSRPMGAIGLLGPSRLPYPEIAGLLATASNLMSAHLTRSLAQFKIGCQPPESPIIPMIYGSELPQKARRLALEDHRHLEDRHESN